MTTYEVVGEGIAKADAFYAERQVALDAQWAWIEGVGGSGFRPAHDGGLRSVFFDGPIPKGWRSIGKQGGKTEAQPRLSTKSGKAIRADMSALPCQPRPDALASALGYSPREMAIDSARGTIYFPTELRLDFPVARTFVRLPRFSGDGFDPDAAILRALPESEFMKALEDHNAEAKRQRESAGATNHDH